MFSDLHKFIEEQERAARQNERLLAQANIIRNLSDELDRLRAENTQIRAENTQIRAACREMSVECSANALITADLRRQLDENTAVPPRNMLMEELRMQEQTTRYVWEQMMCLKNMVAEQSQGLPISPELIEQFETYPGNQIYRSLVDAVGNHEAVQQGMSMQHFGAAAGSKRAAVAPASEIRPASRQVESVPTKVESVPTKVEAVPTSVVLESSHMAVEYVPTPVLVESVPTFRQVLQSERVPVNRKLPLINTAEQLRSAVDGMLSGTVQPDDFLVEVGKKASLSAMQTMDHLDNSFKSALSVCDGNSRRIVQDLYDKQTPDMQLSIKMEFAQLDINSIDEDFVLCLIYSICQ